MNSRSFIVFFLVLCAAVGAAAAGKSGVRINNVVMVGDDAHLTLVNHGPGEVDLSGWSLGAEQDAAGEGQWTLPDGIRLQVGSELVIAKSAAGFRKERGRPPDLEFAPPEGREGDPEVPDLSGDGQDAVLSVTPGGGAMVLRNADGRLHSHVSYGVQTPEHLRQETASFEVVGSDQVYREGTSVEPGKLAPEALVEGAAAEDPASSLPVSKTPMAPMIPGEPEGENLWTWVSFGFALLIVAFFLTRRREDD